MNIWVCQIDFEPEFNEEYPTDPVDWECHLHNIETGEVIYITFTGTIEGEGDDEVVLPWKEEDVMARLHAMANGLIYGVPK